MPSRMTTTSSPCSTRRLAFSIASSATCVCSSLGRSNVEEMTSPLTVRLMSVTSSGRSSMSSTMSLTSGLLASIDLAIVFMTVVLPAFGRRHDDAALALADRRHEVDDPRRHVRRIRRVLEAQPLVGEQRREVLEAGPAAGRLGVAAVDGLDVEQRRVLLVATGRPARAGDVVALAQAVLAGELHRDVGVVAARQVALDAQEAVALVAHVEVARHGDDLARRRHAAAVGTTTTSSPASSPCGPSRPATGTALAAAPAPAVAALAVVLAPLGRRPAGRRRSDRRPAAGRRPGGRRGGAAARSSVGVLTRPSSAATDASSSLVGSAGTSPLSRSASSHSASGSPSSPSTTSTRRRRDRGRLRPAASTTMSSGSSTSAISTTATRVACPRHRSCRCRARPAPLVAAGASTVRATAAGRLQDLPDDVGLLRAGAGLHAERLGDRQQLVLVLRFQDGLFECLCGHECLFLGETSWEADARSVPESDPAADRCCRPTKLGIAPVQHVRGNVERGAPWQPR